MPKPKHTTKYKKREERSAGISYLVHVDPSPDANLFKNTESASYLGQRVAASNQGARQRAFGRFEGQNGIGILRVNDVRLMMDKQDWRCMYCKDKITFRTCEIDHVYPIIKGGDHYLYNVVLTCRVCNNLKRDRTLRRFCKKAGYDFEEIAQEIGDLYCIIHKELYGDKDDMPEWKVD
jgi:5-methylcytosine-specific restriction endonuclease McrA